MGNSGKWLVLLLFFCALTGCGKEKFSVPDQQAAFLAYLKSKGSMDTVDHEGVFRVYADQPPREDEPSRPTRKERLQSEAPGMIDTGAVVIALGGAIAGNPLAEEAPSVDSLRAWAGRLNRIATWLSGKHTEWARVDLGPALDFGLLNLGVCADSLAKLSTRLSAQAQDIHQDRDSLREFSESIVPLGELIRAVGDLMTEVAGWPDPGLVAPGDEVAFYYSGHLFDKTNGAGAMFTSNVEPIHNLSGAAGFPLLPEPMRVRVGDRELIRGVDRGLQGELGQNFFLLFLTADMAYGGRYIGTVPSGSPVVFRIEICDLVKQ